MATNFPTSLDSFTNISTPTSTTLETEVGGRTHSEFHNDYNDSIEALEAKVGVDGSAVTTSHSYKIATLETADGQNVKLTGDQSISGNKTFSNLKIAALSGMIKTSSGAPSVATPATDYVAPGATTTSGLTMSTARLLGRTTASTGAVEEISIGAGLSMSSGSIVAGATGASVYSSSSITLTTTPTAVACNSENWDSGSVHDNATNNTRLTAPVTGVYTVGILCSVFSNTSGDYQAVATIRKNGSTTVGSMQVHPFTSGSGGGYGNLSFSIPVSLSANDYVEVLLSKSSSTPTMNTQNSATDFAFFMKS